jgi:hypothetical protein
MLDLELLKTDIVVLSESNNPRLLNHDFLERNAIIPKGWIPSNIVVTPPFALIQYENGISIQVEENKLQFTCSKPSEFNWASELPKIATTYLDVLPHVSYKAVGLNFQLISKQPKGQDAEDQLIEKLMKTGPWLQHTGGLTGVVIEYQFRKNQPWLNLRVGVRETSSPQGSMLEGFIFNANSHYDFTPTDVTPRREYMTSLADKYDEILHLINLLPLEQSWQKLQ